MKKALATKHNVTQSMPAKATVNIVIFIIIIIIIILSSGGGGVGSSSSSCKIYRGRRCKPQSMGDASSHHVTQRQQLR